MNSYQDIFFTSTFEHIIKLGLLNIQTEPGFENPGHTGHMCPATFGIRQPHLAAGPASHIDERIWLASG